MKKNKQAALEVKCIACTNELLAKLEGMDLSFSERFVIAYTLLSYYMIESNHRLSVKKHKKQNKAGAYLSKKFAYHILEGKAYDVKIDDLAESADVSISSIGVGSYEVH